MSIWLRNASQLALQALAEVLEPPPPLDFLAWAEANVEFTARESPFPGPYNRGLFPYFDEILRALGPDDPCRFVTLCKSAQIGGTVLANIFTLGTLDLDPQDVLFTHPTEDNARRWSKLKLSPMLRGMARLRNLFPSRSRDGSDSVLYKERADGRGAIQISGANSPASLSQVTMRRQVQDDLAKWDMNSAGDPEKQADSRSRAHPFAKVFKISTPLIQPGCRITRNLEAGSQEYPEVPCPHCDTFQVLTWENMHAHLDEAHPERAHFVCEACGCEINEHHRPAMLARLRWTARNPAMMREHRSFWIWSAYSSSQSFELIAREWIGAKGDPASEQVFLNDTVGVAFRSLGESVPWEDLRDRGAESFYAKGTIPVGGLVLTIGVDCQGDRVEYQVVAWGRDLRRWVVDYGVIPGHISEGKTQAALDALVDQTWPNAVGRRLRADMTGIDGNAWTEDVWSWVKRWPSSRVVMLRGANTDTAPLLQRVKKERNKAGQLLKYSARFYNFGTSVLKMALYRNLQKLDELSRAYVGFPKGLEDEYYRQLTSESRKPVKQKTGFTVYKWVKDPSQANEGLDTHLQAEAAAIRFGVRTFQDKFWDALEHDRETRPVDEHPQLDLEDPAWVAPLPTAPAVAPTPDVAAPVNMVRPAPSVPVASAAPPRKPGGFGRLAGMNRRSNPDGE